MNCEEKPVLQVKNLTVRYGKGCPQCQTHLEKNRCTVCGTVWAANDVSVEVYPGEVLGIVGESGSGKSTLMQSLYFDIAPTSGEAYLQDYKDGKESIWLASAAEQRHIKNCIMAWSIRTRCVDCGCSILRHRTLPKSLSQPETAAPDT